MSGLKDVHSGELRMSDEERTQEAADAIGEFAKQSAADHKLVARLADRTKKTAGQTILLDAINQKEKGFADPRELAQIVADAGEWRQKTVDGIVAADAAIQQEAQRYHQTCEAFIKNVNQQFDKFSQATLGFADTMRQSHDAISAERDRLENG